MLHVLGMLIKPLLHVLSFYRFHIFCSHALCEQEMSAFDPKINNENLTKCLQTLKEFYNDLYKEKVSYDLPFTFKRYLFISERYKMLHKSCTNG